VGNPVDARFPRVRDSGHGGRPRAVVPEQSRHNVHRLRDRPDAGVRALLTDTSCAEEVEGWAWEGLPPGVEVATTDGWRRDPAGQDASSGSSPDLLTGRADTDHRRIVLLQYTSGSTNSPKGVMVSVGNLFSNLHTQSVVLSARAAKVRRGGWIPHFDRFGGLYPNPSVTGVAVAAVTDRIGIRPGSVVAPLHDALRIAEEWSVVDNLSGGRTAISFGSGWHPTDFSLRPEAFDRRQPVTLETIETVRRLWRGTPVPRRTGAGDSLELNVYPAPVQPDLPVWLTSAGSPDTFRTAGEIGAGVLTHLVKTGLPVLTRNIAAYRDAFRAHGPAMPRRHVTVMLHTFLGGDDAARGAASGSGPAGHPCPARGGSGLDLRVRDAGDERPNM
jgi:Luciferase-like monooxygenase/AMP-binding enzyme